ncbi:hypothetical protein QAD02_020107 [Eretmocerus hayati]|uniref:Uncharacterized protein n=1 Tax=Eretmocerus hayati TaxID=131215 RepID=A0ACC2PR93_9HYME|nr:hypothetical protein QAD02_020107 [Eretmocerus hayati]
MAAETEIEVSVVSEEDADSRQSPEPVNGKRRRKLDRGSPSPPPGNATSLGLDLVGPKGSLRPACNAGYTSFSISSILGRSESPAAGCSPLQRTPSNGARPASPNGGSTGPRGPTAGASAHSPLLAHGGFVGADAASADAARQLIGHSASADLAMLSR